MLAEPKTSPATKRAQAVYGVSVAIIYFILVMYAPQNLFWAQNVLFIALLLGNLMYALYRIRGQETLRKYLHK
jgi:Na+-translocating ferredoxin:NAD+ oxidoreductase RnfD subunit